jgi:hypothetical protein
MNMMMIPSELLPGGKQVESVNGPLRTIAVVLQAVRPCYEEQKFGQDRVWRRVDLVREKRNFLLPRAVAVRKAFNVLHAILHDGVTIDRGSALQMVTVLLKVLAKKKDDPVSAAAFALLFDKDLDDVGTALNLWKQVPRHPMIVALGIQRLFHKQVFAPAPVELCNACHVVFEQIESHWRISGGWLLDLADADAELCELDRAAWASAYTTAEGLAAIEAATVCLGVKRSYQGRQEDWKLRRAEALEVMHKKLLPKRQHVLGTSKSAAS